MRLLKINLCKHIPLYNLYINLLYISFICVYIDINTHTYTHKHTPLTQSTEHTHGNTVNDAELKSKNIIKKLLAGLKLS